ncbi:MAG: hypothetical protein JWN67_5005 [Actinomycetia bacterium]|nr:hypothetical protein [Actinomycetes bacterium]
MADDDLALIPLDLPTEVEQAIRRHERRRIAALLDGDLRRCAHAMQAVLADPPIDRDRRQQMARMFTTPQRRFLKALLDGDMQRMALLLAVLIEPIDPGETG